MSEYEAAMKEVIDGYGEKAGMFVSLILQDADQFVSDIEHAIEQDNSGDVGLAAHSLKSIMKQLGAQDIGDLAFQLETAGKDGNLDACQTVFPELKDAYSKTRDFLSALA